MPMNLMSGVVLFTTRLRIASGEPVKETVVSEYRNYSVKYVEGLVAVYEAVLPLHVSGSHIYDLDIKLGEAIAAVKALSPTQEI